MDASLSTLLNCIPSRVKAWQSSRGQMFPRHFTTKKIRYWISWKINVFSPRKEKKRKERKENDSHPFRYSMRNCSNRTKNIPQAGPTLQLSAIGERETKRRRRENGSTYRRQKITRAEITGATPRPDIFPFINIHCVRFRSPRLSRETRTKTTFANQTFHDSRNRIVNALKIRADSEKRCKPSVARRMKDGEARGRRESVAIFSRRRGKKLNRLIGTLGNFGLSRRSWMEPRSNFGHLSCSVIGNEEISYTSQWN